MVTSFINAVAPTHHKILRKLRTIDLGHVSPLKQYRVDMRFKDKASSFSEYVTMVEFTLKDRDDFYVNLWLVLVGTAIGAAFGVIGTIGGSDSVGGVRGRLISHLINKKFPAAAYFRCIRVHDGLFSLSGIRLESEQAQNFREKHGKKPLCMKCSPKWD